MRSTPRHLPPPLCRRSNHPPNFLSFAPLRKTRPTAISRVLSAIIHVLSVQSMYSQTVLSNYTLMKFVPSGLFWRSLSRFDRPFVFSFDSEALIVCGAGPRLPFRLPDSMNVNVFVTYSLKLVSPPVFLHTWFVSR